MNKKGILAILIIIAVIIVVVVIVSGNKGNVGNGEGVTGEVNDIKAGGTETFDPTVPGEDVELTQPKVSAPAAPGVKAQLRVFDMSASENGFIPEQIVVNQGDTINVKLKAPTVGYDIALPDLGLYQSVDQGVEKTLAFQALTPGTFTYLCRDMCPGGKEIKGSLIVKGN